MKKDIPIHAVTDIGIAIIPMEIDQAYEVYLINKKNRVIRNIIICSKSYGEWEGKKIETATTRYFLDYLGNENAQKFEIMESNLAKVANEYWISFSLDNYLYDRKIVFVQGSIDQMNFSFVPYVEQKGVIII